MTARTQQAFKTLLAAWLVVSILAAGALVHLPDLHAHLHCEASSCSESVCESADEHCPDSEPGLPEDHRCLTELLAAGCADAPLALGFVAADFVAISEVALLDAEPFSDSISTSDTLGRAPPIC